MPAAGQPSMTNMVMMMGLMYLGSSITIDGEEYADRRIILYACAVLMNLAQLGVLAYSYICITRNKDKTVVTVPAQKMMGQEVGPAKTMTVEEYDMSKVKEALNQLVISALIVGFITHKWESHRPLMLNTMFAINNAMDSPLFKVYVLRQQPTGALKRPWTPPSMNPLGNLMGGQGADAAAATTTEGGEGAAAPEQVTDGTSDADAKKGKKGGNKGHNNNSNKKASAAAASAAAASKAAASTWKIVEVEEDAAAAPAEEEEEEQEEEQAVEEEQVAEDEVAAEEEVEEVQEQKEQAEDESISAAAAAVANNKTEPVKKRKSNRAE